MNRRHLQLLIRTWLTIAPIDAAFASCLAVFAYKQPVARVWQGVASTVLGPSAIGAGSRTVAVGLLLHVTVAFVWSAVFLTLAVNLPALRRAIATLPGVLAVALLYGPLIWSVMSFVVIPLATGRPPTIGLRWWIQVAGHVPFVALPIVATVARGLLSSERAIGLRAATVGA